jgi:protein TorT
MRRKFSRYLVLLGLVAVTAVAAAACGGGGEEPAAAPAPAEPAPAPPAETGEPAETGAPAETGEPAEAGAAVGGPGVDEVQTSAGEVYADPAQNDPAVMKSVIEAEDWAFPVQFTDCTASDTDPDGCTPGTEVPGVYTPLPVSEITQPWNICISFPHLKDAYWIASNYGGVVESQRDGLEMTLVEAGGYTELANQLSQLDNCVAQGAQALVIGGISYDGLDAKLQEFIDQGIIVIDLINGMKNPSIQAHSLISYYKMGEAVGTYLASLDTPIKVGWFPGPPGAGWVETSNQGFQDAIAGSQVTIAGEPNYGDTGKDVQLGLIENALEANPDINYIAGNAVAAEAAVGAVAERGLTDKVGIAADYLIPTTFDFIEQGKIACSPTDQNPMQVRIAVDQAVRLLEGKPLLSGFAQERVEPYAQLVCGPAAGDLNNLDDFVFGATFAPDDFKPTFKVG